MSTRAEEIFGRPATGPLAGVVVADLSRVLAGPYCTMLLADMGALVVKVESPAGDDTRTWRPPELAGESTYYLSVNRNKHSIALDFTDPVQLDVARRIVSRADVVVENFRPGGLVPFGLDAASVRARDPGVVYASITGFGDGAGGDLPGYDVLAQALSGLMDLTGEVGGAPHKVGVALVDVVTGLHAATGILAALHERQRTGTGEHVRVDLLSSALSALVNQSSAAVAAGVVPTRMGNEHPSLYPYGPFPTRDRDLVVAVGNDAQFRRLCEVLGLPGTGHDPRFATMSARNANRRELRTILVQRLVTRGADEWFAELRAATVPAGPILTVAGGIELAEELGLEPVAVTGSGSRRVPTVRHPIGYGRTSVDYSQAPPRLDADRERVLRWLELAVAPR